MSVQERYTVVGEYLHVSMLISLFVFLVFFLPATGRLAHQDGRPTIIVACVVSMFLEGFRLYIGFSGNLGEKVPQMMLFIVMSLFPCQPLSISLAIIAYLGSLQACFVGLVVHNSLAILCLLLSFPALWKLAKIKSIRFSLSMKFDKN